MTWKLNDLRRSHGDRLIGGVCGGLARCTPWATWVWRALLLASLLVSGYGVVVYLILWIAVQEADPAVAHAPSPVPVA